MVRASGLVIEGQNFTAGPADRGNECGRRDTGPEEPDGTVAHEEVDASRVEAVKAEVVIAVDDARSADRGVGAVGRTPRDRVSSGTGVGPAAAVTVLPRIGGYAEIVARLGRRTEIRRRSELAGLPDLRPTRG